MSFESSLTTHPGELAAEACSFMAHIIVRALNRTTNETASEFLDSICIEYLNILNQETQNLSNAKLQIIRLIKCQEPETSTEYCWNWKSKKLGLERTIKNRGRMYNGYPVSPGYFGAFSFDGLSMALNGFYNTTSFNSAIIKVINFCGDSDTTGAICAQMAGAFYGSSEIDETWIKWLNRWDDREVELRAILLCYGLQTNEMKKEMKEEMKGEQNKL